jgi:hypothetical protein
MKQRQVLSPLTKRVEHSQDLVLAGLLLMVDEHGHKKCNEGVHHVET